MEDEPEFGRPRLVVNNGREPREPLLKQGVSTYRGGWRHLSVHCESNEHTEWWVGQVFAGREVYRIGLFTDIETALDFALP